MAQPTVGVESKRGRSLQNNLVEERAVADLDIDNSEKSVHTRKLEGVLTTDPRCKMESLTTSRATHVPLKGPGVRLKGIRRELLEKHLSHIIREEIDSELSPPAAEADFSSTTQRDFCVPGFVPGRSKSTQAHDYKSEPAITFWSENCQQIQGVTPICSLSAPFRKWALFSTPISEQLDEEDQPPDS